MSGEFHSNPLGGGGEGTGGPEETPFSTPQGGTGVHTQPTYDKSKVTEEKLNLRGMVSGENASLEGSMRDD